MRPNAWNGKLIREPESLQRAAVRWRQLEREIVDITSQLADARREKRFKTAYAYSSWRAAASKKMREFETERRLLAEWIVERVPANEILFRGAYELIKRLQKEIDFYPEEEVLIAALDAKFGPGENRD